MLDVNVFDSMRVGLASPELIRSWSHGEVKKPETINYRTLKPERDGLFCERIFGPVHDWECHCGKYKRVRYKGIICDRCGVEVTRAKVRRERMGHIELAAPVSHIWYFKGIPSRIALILGITPKNLERVLYFASYIVMTPPENPNAEFKCERLSILSEGEYRRARELYGDSFTVGIGAEAIQQLLRELDLDSLATRLRGEIHSNSAQKRFRAIRRLEVVEAFRKSGNKPEWMILNVIPVIPPDLRPMVQLDGGRFATSDLNDLYRRVINRNNRLKKMLTINIPDLILRNEKRMLQEAVDALIDNGRRGRPVTGTGNRALKSLSDMLKGKQGRFRQNLLGKRVDYSGRSVIVVGPELKLHQCGLPKEMALELFKPFVMKKLSADGNTTIKAAKRKVERGHADVWGVLEEVIKEHPVLLNRAPTLHRLGIQAFEPVLTEGRALKLHPLACTAYNADFDGDQMAIHLPLSAEAQAEARVLMLAANHILAPKDGKPIIVPTQDMVLGTYYLTVLKPDGLGAGRVVSSLNEALMLYERGLLDLHSPIRAKLLPSDFPPQFSNFSDSLIRTSLGRLLFNEILPPQLRFFHSEPDGLHLGIVMNKKQLGILVARCFHFFGAAETAFVIDSVKNIGYHYACLAGISVAISDVLVPPDKPAIISRTLTAVHGLDSQYNIGLITSSERYNKVINLWNTATEKVADSMLDNLKFNAPFNPIYMMADSGARGNKQQMRQLAGMRGLMADPSGKIIDLPITANFREGLSVSDYFISSHGARKGLTDTALRTADSGYLTRRLVDVAQDLIIREKDCDMVEINLAKMRSSLIEETFDNLERFHDRLLGSALSSGVNFGCGELLPAGRILGESEMELLGTHHIRSVSLGGVSLDLGTSYDTIFAEFIGKRLAEPIPSLNFAVGRILSLADLTLILESSAESFSFYRGQVRGITVSAIRDGSAVIESLAERILGRVLASDVLDYDGNLIASSGDFIDLNLAEKISAVCDSVKIRSVLTCKSEYGVCQHCYGSDLSTLAPVEIGEAVGIIAAQSIGEPGTQLTMRTFHTGGVAGDDITQGLPRVEELFEARKPKHHSIISEISGTVSFAKNDKNDLPMVVVNPASGLPREYTIPFGSRIIVSEGQEIPAGAKLTEGSINPHDILRINGLTATQQYLVYEVQKVYKSQGVEINDKHLEVMVRQMLHKVKIEDPGESSFLPGEFVDLNSFENTNARLIAENQLPAVARPILLGITKASLATDSFLSAASFQETTKVLTDAAIKGKIDPLIGLKENVIIGKLIPAGTGMPRYRDLKVVDSTAE